MGASYNRAVTKFNNGDYPNANNKEDDVAIIAAKLGFRADDVGNTPATSATLTATSTGSVSATGIIEQSTDIDMFSFVTGAGLVSITVVPFISPVHTAGNNLDVGLQLRSLAGVVLQSSEPTTTSSASLSYTVMSAGTYYVAVYATGNSVTGYSVYGSAGQYTLSGSIVPVSTTTSSTPTTSTATTKTTSTISTSTSTTRTTVSATTMSTTTAKSGTAAQGPASAVAGTVLYASGLSGSTADSVGWVLSSDVWTWGEFTSLTQFYKLPTFYKPFAIALALKIGLIIDSHNQALVL